MRRPGFRKASQTLLALISSAALALVSARAQKPGPAISKDELVRMVKSGMATGDLVKLVRDYGVSFKLTDPTAQELRDAGGGAELLEALRALENPPAPATPVISPVPRVEPPSAPPPSEVALPGRSTTLEFQPFALARSLTAHAGGVNSVAFSPDGRQLASASDDDLVKVWEVATGSEIRSLAGHRDQVHSVAFSPDGQLLASASQDGTVKIWQVAAGREVRTLKGHRSWVTSVAFSPDGRWLASGSDDTTVKIWEVSTGREVQTLRGQNANVESVAFSPDGRWLASGSLPHTITLWRQPE